LTPNTVFSLDAFSLLSRKAEPGEACRPFDRERDGMVAGEGAGFLVIEALEHARKRGARIYAEVVGYGNASSAYHIYQPDPSGSGIMRAVNRALQDARVEPESIDWICADGIATQASDRAESQALQAVFRNHLPSIPVSATKSMTGHMGSGAGAAEAAYAVMALVHDVAPPTLNYTNPDNDCRLAIVAHNPREQKITNALSINQGIGGQSTALILRKV